MNFKKIIISGIILSILSGTTLPVAAHAKQFNSNVKITSNQLAVVKDQTSQEELDKLSNYVKLDTNTNQFIVLSSAKYNLNKNEMDYINKSILKSNNMIMDASKNSALSINIKNNNTVQIKPKSNNSICSIGLMSINKKAYWDYDMHWWGPSIFLSHSLVQKMQSQVGNTTVYFGGAATAKALEQALIKAGLASGPAGWIGLVVGGEVVYDYDCIVSRCSRTGVFVDVNWVGACNIYSA